jgi:hypothetical protein
MPFCTKCRTEYVPGVMSCSDCGVPLVEALPAEPIPGDVHWAELPCFPSLPQGEMVRAELERCGIRTMLKKDVFGSGFGYHGTVIFVPQEQYDEAATIRREMIGD